MAAPPRPIRVLNGIERRVLTILRARYAGEAGLPREQATGLEDADVDPLVIYIRECKRTIFPTNSAFVSGDELLILGVVALAQRLNGYEIQADARLILAAANLGQRLFEVGTTLPFSAMALDRLNEAKWVVAKPRAPGSGESVAPRARRQSMAPHGSLKARAIEMARAGPVRSQDLQSAGISRQYLSLLVHEGIFEKTGFGRYRLLLSLPETDKRSKD